MNDNYDSIGTSELRKLIREKGIGSGLALSGANKETCLKLLRGELTWDQFKVGDGTAFSSSQSASTCQHQHETAAAPTVDGGSAAAMLGQALAALMPKTADMEEVRKLAVDAGHDAAVNAFTPILEQMNAKIASLSAPVRVEYKKPDGEIKALGVQHKDFPTLLKITQCRNKDGFVPNVYLYGPAGTGKTTAAIKLAEALGLDFYYNGAIDSEYKLSGFIDASGTFRSRPFYEAFSKGGVYLFDELDSSMPSAVLAFNAALANGHADFPIGRVERHKDCIIIAAGNTCMRGDGNMAGFQRMKQDAAFRDRFVFMSWEIDEQLESSIDAAYGDDWGWLDKVRRWRRNAKRAGIRDFEVTPRAVDNGLTLLRGGMPLDVVTDLCVRKGVNYEVWAKVEG